ncbi:MAG: general secretion pathway protein GspB [Candidatus Rokuibacteriota bacterium]
MPAAAPAPAPTASAPAPTATTREPALAAADPQLQRLRLQFVAYSDVAAERFVFIDNRKLVEGQTVENGVVVERIDPASVVLKHAGGRFVLRADPSAGR